MTNFLDFILRGDLLYILLFLIIFGYQGFKYYTFYRKKRGTLKNVLTFINYFFYGIQVFILFLIIIFILLSIISSEYRTGMTSGPGMGPAFGHGFLIAISIWFITPLSFICLFITKQIGKYFDKEKISD